MELEKLLSLAEYIATKAHEGQFRRCGVVPYIEHPRAVVRRLDEGDAEGQIVAWLHDVIEDSEMTATNLVDAGIPAYLVAEVELLTKQGDTVYDEYIQRIAASPIARRVKIADMLTNLSDTPTDKQIRKYAQGLLVLVAEE